MAGNIIEAEYFLAARVKGGDKAALTSLGKEVTTVKKYITDTKEIASRIFGINYVKA
jgi:hypothetical protein